MIVIVLMNTYPLLVSEDLVFRSKYAALLSGAASINTAVTGLDELTEENVSGALTGVEPEGVSRAIVTDPYGRVLYDTREAGNATGYYVFYTELVSALQGSSAVYCVYKEGAFHSSAAQPVLYRNEIIGGVYVYEYDTQQASLLLTLQNNLMTISVGVAVLVLMLSLVFSRQITSRLANLLNAIRGVREGAYNQRAVITGHDEFTQIAGEFNDLVDRLQETEGARRQFVSDASHELKTPLAAIRLLTDSILQNENMEGETLREFVGDIGQEAERLSRITEDLLRLTRLDSGVIEAPSRVAVEAVLGMGLAMFAFLPSVLAIMGNPRTGSDSLLLGGNLWYYSNPQRYLGILHSFFFAPDMPALNNFFPDHGAQWASLSAYLPVVGAVGVLAYFFAAKKSWLKKILRLWQSRRPCRTERGSPASQSIFRNGSLTWASRRRMQ